MILVKTVIFTFVLKIIINEKLDVKRICLDKSIFLNIDKRFIKSAEVTFGTNVQLECNFCDENYQDEIVEWYYKKRDSYSFKKKEPAVYKKIVPPHNLNIVNFNFNESVIYLCKRKHAEDETTFIFVLDGVSNDRVLYRINNLKQWREYKKTELNPINKKLDMLSNSDNIKYKLFIIWEPWSLCEKHPGKYKSLRKRTGFCRLHSYDEPNIRMKKSKAHIISEDYDISCHSIILNKTLPEISKIVYKVPILEISEICDPKYNPDNTMNLKSGFKYKTTIRIGENSHITLSCPEIALDSKVQWYKDQTPLDPLFRNNMAENNDEPHVTIDTLNTLYLLHVTKNEEAMYSCIVDGRNVQQFNVKVISKSSELNQEFIRYSIYLGFVMSLTAFCYCAGMCVAWHRRSSFADPLKLLSKRKHSVNVQEKELLLGNFPSFHD